MKNVLKKLTTIFIVITLLVCGVPLSGSMFSVNAYAKSISQYSVGDIIEFGSYPQSQVKDEKLLSALNSLPINLVSYEYYSGTGSWHDGKMSPGNFMKYADVKYKGAKYRAVMLTEYRPGQTGGLTDADSSVQDEKGYELYYLYWFAYEPIKWRVLDPTQGLVMSETILDAQAFNNTVYYDGVNYYSDTNRNVSPNYYETSSIRKWLNADFINTAFVYNESVLVNGEPFLISSEEARNRDYGFNPQRYDNTLQAKFSDYSLCQGLPAASNGFATWYFRSPGQAACHATFVNEHGYIYGYNQVNSVLGIRPLIKLNTSLDIPEPDIPEVPINYIVMGREFENNLDYFAKNVSSSNYNPVLANIMAAFSKAAYSQDDVLQGYESFGFSEYGVYDYDIEYNHHACPYSFAFKKSDYSDDMICMVSVTGTRIRNIPDWIGDIEILPIDGGKHAGFEICANRIYEKICDYLKDNKITGNIKYFITGHSRGGAVGNLLSVKLMENGIKPSDIYNYNFATPDQAFRVLFPSYDNIFNLCNRGDVVPFLPGNLCSGSGSPGYSWDKFGKTYWFTKNNPNSLNPFSGHDMELYLEFFDQQLTPDNWGDSCLDQFLDTIDLVTYWITKVYCPVDVIITDNNGNTIASVVGGEVNCYDHQIDDVIIFTDGDKKIIGINGEKNFNVILLGTDNGEMLYSVEKYNLQEEKVIESKTFEHVNLEKDKIMFSPVSDAENISDIELFVMGEENGKPVATHTIDERGNETEIYRKNVEKIKILKPSTTTINYGDTLVLRLAETDIPEDYSVEWYIILGTGISAYKNDTGTECRATSISNGSATFVAVLVDQNGKAVTDENGNEINDSITITSKAGFFQRLISFFKNLFGINRIIY